MSAVPSRRLKPWQRAVAIAAGLVASLLVQAAVPAPPDLREPVNNSPMDASLFYQLLLGEMELGAGDANAGFEQILDAAVRTKDEQLFKRAVEIALQAHAGELALKAVTAWRAAVPRSSDALRYQLQLLVALNRPVEAMEPLGALLLATPPSERSAAIAQLPRLLQRVPDPAKTAGLVQDLLQPYAEAPETRTAARVTIGRLWLNAKDTTRAAVELEQARKDDPSSPGPALLALEMLPGTPSSEAVIVDYLKRPKPDAMVRLGYVRALMTAERYVEAVPQLQALTAEHPQVAPPWLTLGALHLELHHPKEAEEALQRYVQLVQSGQAAPPPAQAQPHADDDDDDDTTPSSAAAPDRGLVQAWLLLAQAAEMKGDYAAAEQWLNKVDSPQRALEVQTRRAGLLARQGKLKEARALIQKVPEKSPEDARAKLLAEAGLLREAKHWREAEEVLAAANKRFPDDTDLLYEQAMLEEKLDRMDEMEKLLRRVIELKPDHQHAYNALGYSLADRNKRLPEAKQLIEKALSLSPGEPFITDSLGWVEYRMGHRTEALQLLRKAYGARPDVEIAAHLGEVLWVDGQREEARKVLRDAQRKDSKNEVLGEVLARLKVDL